MSWIRRLANVFARRDVDKNIDAELEFHVAMRAADLARGGRRLERTSRASIRRSSAIGRWKRRR